MLKLANKMNKPSDRTKKKMYNTQKTYIPT